MARKCTICTHEQRTEIETAMIRNESLQNIALRFGISSAAVFRHGKYHLPEVLAKARAAKDSAQVEVVAQEAQSKEADDQAHADVVMAGLIRCVDRVNLLFDACHEYLTDPESPGKYHVGPRSGDVMVTYLEAGEDGENVRRKRKLSDLLADMEERAGITVTHTTIKHADIRELILKTMSEARANLSFLVDLEVLQHNARQSRLFAEELLNFVEELGPGLLNQFLNRIRQKKLIRSELTMEGISHEASQI